MPSLPETFRFSSYCFPIRLGGLNIIVMNHMTHNQWFWDPGWNYDRETKELNHCAYCMEDKEDCHVKPVLLKNSNGEQYWDTEFICDECIAYLADYEGISIDEWKQLNEIKL